MHIITDYRMGYQALISEPDFHTLVQQLANNSPVGTVTMTIEIRKISLFARRVLKNREWHQYNCELQLEQLQNAQTQAMSTFARYCAQQILELVHTTIESFCRMHRAFMLN